jgi:hypothetical protein
MEVHKGIYWYSTDRDSNANLVALPVDRVREIQALNRKGKKVEKLKMNDEVTENEALSADLLKNNSLTRFDPPDKKENRRDGHHRRKNRRFNDRRKKQ